MSLQYLIHFTQKFKNYVRLQCPLCHNYYVNITTPNIPAFGTHMKQCYSHLCKTLDDKSYHYAICQLGHIVPINTLRLHVTCTAIKHARVADSFKAFASRWIFFPFSTIAFPLNAYVAVNTESESSSFDLNSCLETAFVESHQYHITKESAFLDIICVSLQNGYIPVQDSVSVQPFPTMADIFKSRSPHLLYSSKLPHETDELYNARQTALSYLNVLPIGSSVAEPLQTRLQNYFPASTQDMQNAQNRLKRSYPYASSCPPKSPRLPQPFPQHPSQTELETPTLHSPLPSSPPPTVPNSPTPSSQPSSIPPVQPSTMYSDPLLTQVHNVVSSALSEHKTQLQGALSLLMESFKDSHTSLYIKPVSYQSALSADFDKIQQNTLPDLPPKLHKICVPLLEQPLHLTNRKLQDPAVVASEAPSATPDIINNIVAFRNNLSTPEHKELIRQVTTNSKVMFFRQLDYNVYSVPYSNTSSSTDQQSTSRPSTTMTQAILPVNVEQPTASLESTSWIHQLETKIYVTKNKFTNFLELYTATEYDLVKRDNRHRLIKTKEELVHEYLSDYFTFHDICQYGPFLIVPSTYVTRYQRIMVKTLGRALFQRTYPVPQYLSNVSNTKHDNYLDIPYQDVMAKSGNCLPVGTINNLHRWRTHQPTQPTQPQNSSDDEEQEDEEDEQIDI